MTNRRRQRRLAGRLLLAAALAVTGGCRQDMHDQAKLEPLERSPLFADGSGSRPIIEGTVARGLLNADARLYRGLEPDGSFVTELPVPLTAELVARGRERFDIFCSPCHGRTGDGQGMIVQRGFKRPESLHAERLRQVQDGYFYDVISNGFGQMSSYAAQVAPTDRWAIVTYVRALQLGRRTPVELLSADERARLDGAEPPPAAEGTGH